MRRKCTISNGKLTLEFDSMSEAARYIGLGSHGFTDWHLKKGYANGWKIDTGELEPSYIDISGMKFGRLTVLYPEETEIRGKYIWVCRCECGKLAKARSNELKNGTRISCGCARETHGMSHSRLYHIWKGMKQRCDDDTVPYYKNYGGRGITYCEEWKRFEPFRDWALENGYDASLTLDRIDNNGNYCPENCRWATMEEQSNNQRTNRYITYNGETHTLIQWSRITGLTYTTISNRLERGMSVEEALFAPNPNEKRPLVAIDENTGVIYWFESSKDAERRGYSRPAIWRAINGEYKTHHGLVWKYA